MGENFLEFLKVSKHQIQEVQQILSMIKKKEYVHTHTHTLETYTLCVCVCLCR